MVVIVWASGTLVCLISKEYGFHQPTRQAATQAKKHQSRDDRSLTDATDCHNHQEHEEHSTRRDGNDLFECFLWPIDLVVRLWPRTQPEGWNIIVAIATVTLAITAGLGIWQVSSNQRISARAYVGLGDGKGKIADFMPLRGTTTVGIWLHNSGQTPAEYITVNAHYLEDQTDIQLKKFRHLRPVPPIELLWKMEIPAASTQEIPLNIEVKPDQLKCLDEYARIAKLGEGPSPMAQSCFEHGMGPWYQVEGDFEFIDVFGEYCCHPFCIWWDPSEKGFLACGNDSSASAYPVCPKSAGN